MRMRIGLLALALMPALATQAEVPNTDSALSVNTLGVLKLSANLVDTIIAVPWTDCSADSIPVSILATNMVRVANLEAGDTLLVYDVNEAKYNAWTVTEEGDVKVWSAEKMYSDKDPKPIDGLLTTASSQVQCGKAFWLHRVDMDTRADKNVYLCGQMYTNDVNVTVGEGSTLIANPFPVDLALNGGAFSTSDGEICVNQDNYTAGDAIVIPNDSDAPMMVYYDGSSWYTKGKMIYNPISHGFDGGKDTDITIPAGIGFWYVRRGDGAITFRFSMPQAAQPQSGN